MKLFISVAVPLIVGFVGSLATTPEIQTWYKTLSKPAFSPPNWIFGPVWTVLYIFMGISIYLVWKKGFHVKNVKKAVWVFGIHLAINSLWSFVFFAWHWPLGALVVIVTLLAFIVWMMKLFYPINKLSSYLLIPYLAWVSFATVLNASIWILNR